jgi:hypothetical protein
MKYQAILTAIVLSVTTMPAYSQKSWQTTPVNVREIGLDSINGMEISFNQENISVLQGISDKIVIKEYRNANNNKFFARIAKSDGRLNIKRGGWLSWRGFYIVRSRIEIYLPATYKNTLHIGTTDGNIEIRGKHNPDINAGTTSGKITLDIPGDACFAVSVKTVSGKLSVPFPEKLSDKKSQQFITGDCNPDKKIVLKTISGNIGISWKDSL